jgi:hypothetical protein
MKTPPKQVLILNIPRGPVRNRIQPIVVATKMVFQTPVKRQRVIDNIISPPKDIQPVNRRLVF